MFGTEAQLRRRLRDEGYDEDDIEAAIDDFADRGYDSRRDDLMIEELEKETTPC